MKASTTPLRDSGFGQSNLWVNVVKKKKCATCYLSTSSLVVHKASKMCTLIKFDCFLVELIASKNRPFLGAKLYYVYLHSSFNFIPIFLVSLLVIFDKEIPNRPNRWKVSRIHQHTAYLANYFQQNYIVFTVSILWLLYINYF